TPYGCRRYWTSALQERTRKIMKKLHMLACAIVAVIGFSSIGFAQTNTPRVDRREKNQQNRVADGLKDGSITSGEAAKIERDEARIGRAEPKARASGVMRGRERAGFTSEFKHGSREIRRDRRRTPGIDRREQNQQNRVADGLKNGSLTSGEAAKIERDETKI